MPYETELSTCACLSETTVETLKQDPCVPVFASCLFCAKVKDDKGFDLKDSLFLKNSLDAVPGSKLGALLNDIELTTRGLSLLQADQTTFYIYKGIERVQSLYLIKNTSDNGYVLVFPDMGTPWYQYEIRPEDVAFLFGTKPISQFMSDYQKVHNISSDALQAGLDTGNLEFEVFAVVRLQ